MHLDSYMQNTTYIIVLQAGLGSLENPESVTVVLEPEAAAIHCRSARLKNTKVLSNISFQDTYETDYCVLNEIGEGNKIINSIL